MSVFQYGFGSDEGRDRIIDTTNGVISRRQYLAFIRSILYGLGISFKSNNLRYSITCAIDKCREGDNCEAGLVCEA